MADNMHRDGGQACFLPPQQKQNSERWDVFLGKYFLHWKGVGVHLYDKNSPLFFEFLN